MCLGSSANLGPNPKSFLGDLRHTFYELLGDIFPKTAEIFHFHTRPRHIVNLQFGIEIALEIEIPKEETMAFNPHEAGQIIRALQKDHKPLRQLIFKLKDEDCDGLEKKVCFSKLQEKLRTHTQFEESNLQSLLGELDPLDMNLVNKMFIDLQVTEDSDLWSIRIRILAELVEQHLHDEEYILFPRIRSLCNS